MICGRGRLCPCKLRRYCTTRSHNTRIFSSSRGVCVCVVVVGGGVKLYRLWMEKGEGGKVEEEEEG